MAIVTVNENVSSDTKILLILTLTLDIGYYVTLHV